MNKYEDNPEEFERVTGHILGTSGPMTVAELARYMLRQDMGAYARTLGIAVGQMREQQLARAILSRLVDPPKPADSPAPTADAPWCDCENPDQLTFWAHAREGKPVTTHINMSGAPTIEGYTKESVYKQLEFWAELSQGGLAVAQVDDARKANITLEHGDLKGNKLGVTIIRHYKGGKMISAKIVVDTTRNWDRDFSNALAGILLTIRHEYGHGLGAPHTLNESDILYPSPTAKNIYRNAGPGDLAWIRLAHPSQEVSA